MLRPWFRTSAPALASLALALLLSHPASAVEMAPPEAMANELLPQTATLEATHAKQCRPALVYLGPAKPAPIAPALANPNAIPPEPPTGDHAFVDAARFGVARAKTEFHLLIKEYAAKDDAAVEQAIRTAAQEGANLVIALGYATTGPVQELAPFLPKVNFTVVDGLIPPLYPNVQSLTFNDHEGAFLVGFIAAKKSRTDRVGFIGGMDIPLMRNFLEGFTQGVHYVNPDTQIDIDYVGSGVHAWNNPLLAHSKAIAQFDHGADVIFAAAGGSGVGVLQAAQETGNYGIGVDSNQNGLFPGHVLTSMVKRMDLAVYRAIQSCQEKTWQAGTKNLGIREGALDYAVDVHNRTLISGELIEEVADAKDRILNGELHVMPYYPK